MDSSKTAMTSYVSLEPLARVYDDRAQAFDVNHDETSYQHGTNALPYRTSQRPEKSSLLRGLTTKLRTASNHVYGNSRYAVLEDTAHEWTPPDLSHLSGLGYELKENRVPITPQRVDQDWSSTLYRGTSQYVPADRDARQGSRNLGSGLVVGAQLKRDVSKIGPGSLRPTKTDMDRSKSVRLFGQDLADKRHEIVAVNEVIDLSSFEGMHLSQRRSTFGDMNLGVADQTADVQSYFFPSDPKIPNWRPFSMRPPWIVMLVVLAFSLAAAQEWLCQISQRRQKQSPPEGILSFNKLDDVSVPLFFVWKYLPTMITIGYAVLYSIMDFDIRRLEPYYQLSRPQGARASASLNLDHLTMFQYLVPFVAARLRQWTVLSSTIGNIVAASLAPAMQNAAIDLVENSNLVCKLSVCPPAHPDEKRYWVVINPVWSRLVSTSYIVVASIGIFLLLALRRKSGLLSNPVGIAGIASMATKSHILQDFRGLDLATRGQIHKRLAHRTYVLYKSSIWQGEWNSSVEKVSDSHSRLKSPHPIALRLKSGIIFITVLFLVIIGVFAIALTDARVVANRASWLPILVATLIKLVWSTFEAGIRLIEPFYRLSQGNALPQDSLTLDYQATVYGWTAIRATLNGHYVVALVALTSVCLDVLSVTIGSFSVDSHIFLTRPRLDQDSSSGAESYISFWVSLVLSVSILVFSIAVATLAYKRRRHAFLPREPSTIAAVLSFIYASKMLDDFIDTETLTREAMEKRLKSIGKRYGLGWFRGRDGQVHCAIDEEPMVSRYVHGKPYVAAMAGPIPDY